MLTLHNTVDSSKTILKWGAILSISIFLLVIVISIGTSIKEYFYPTPAPAPTVLFGKLPDINFPENFNKRDFNYTLNTLSGGLPQFEDRIKIYKTIQPQPTLLALKNTQKIAAKIGFTSEASLFSGNIYQWSDPERPQRKLRFDVLNSNFNLFSDLLSDQQVLSTNNFPDEKGAISKAESFLSDLSSYPLDFDKNKTKTFLLSIKDNEIIPATSLSSSQLIRVDFFQKDIDNFPIYYPKPPNSTHYVIISGGNFDSRAVAANFFHQSASEISTTYPIKSAKEAFEELKAGKAYVAAYYGNSKEVSIKNVFLGYYLGEEKQDYLLPIIIFEGDNGFFAYVKAVTDEWINR